MNDSYDECLSLYRAARTEEGSNLADRRAVRVGLAASIAAGVHTATGGASAMAIASAGTSARASLIGAKGIIHWLLGGKFASEVVIGVAVGTAVSTSVLVVQRTNPAPQTTVASETKESNVPVGSRINQLRDAVQTRSPRIEQPQPPVARMPSESVVTPNVVSSAVAHPRVAHTEPLKASVRSSGVAPQDGLVEETKALAQVQDALNHRNPSLAWSLLDQQEDRFASGQLGEERAAAKIMALCAAGRIDLADRARAMFLTRFPHSPLTQRVKPGCDR